MSATIASIVTALVLLTIAGPAGAAAPLPNLNPGDGLDISLPPVPPTPDPLVVLGSGLTWIEIATNPPAASINKLYRQGPTGGWLFRQNVAAGVRTVIRDQPLPTGTGYCYRLDTTLNGSTTSRTRCGETDWRVGFEGLQINAIESARVLGLFDWSRTRTLPVGPADAPAIYYMNVLVDHPHTTAGFWRSGIHVQNAPVFVQELTGWNAASAVVTGQTTGRWVFAVVPGGAYNRLRQTMLDQIAAGETPGIKAMVFRNIPVWAGRTYSGDRHNLSYTYLGQQGFEYEAYVGCDTNPNDGLGCVEQEILGWLAHKIAAWVAEGLETLVEGVRGAIGRITRIIKGEVTLRLQFELYNTDPLFKDTRMFSGWRGQLLQLGGVRVHVRQGVAAFYGTTDANGYVEIKVAKNADTKVCVEAENAAVMLTEFLTEELVCIKSIGSLSADRYEAIRVEHAYFNVLAGMTDGRDYLTTVVGHTMPKITVLVGGMANTVAMAGRSFAPCMGRSPNFALGLSAETLGLLAGGPIGMAVGSAIEFFYAVDIVLRTSDHTSRGVPVHEYGHTVMCEMLKTQGAGAFQAAWTDVILATANQSADNDATYLNEAFADFFASQVVGGTNYFPPTGGKSSLSMNYCDAGSACLEENFHELSTSGVSGDLFKAQVRRVVALLHDAFDGHAGSGHPNDGSHWDTSGTLLMLLSGHDSDQSDESIALVGPALRLLFDFWSNRGPYLREETLLGGLADMLRGYGYAQAAICDLFQLHSSTAACPTYAGGSVFGDISVGGSVRDVQVAPSTAPVTGTTTINTTGSLTVR